MDIVEYLLNDCNVGPSGDGSPNPSSLLALCPLLHTVVTLGRTDMLRVMLESKHNTNSVYDVNQKRDVDGATPLFMACNISIHSKECLPHRENNDVAPDVVNEEVTSGSSSKNRFLEIESIQSELVSCLLSVGADPDIGMFSGHRPLYLAAQVLCPQTQIKRITTISHL